MVERVLSRMREQRAAASPKMDSGEDTSFRSKELVSNNAASLSRRITSVGQ